MSMITRSFACVRRLFAPKVSLVKNMDSAAAIRQRGLADNVRTLRTLEAELMSTRAVSLVKAAPKVSLVKDLTSDAAVRQLRWAAATRALRLITARQSSARVVKLRRSVLLAD